MGGRVYAVVLAAGCSTRFEGRKLLEDLGGKPLLHYALSAAQEALPGKVVLVAGHSAKEIIASAKNLADIVVVNPDFASGQGKSLAVGVRACHEFADAVVILLADQPFVTADMLTRLIEAWSGVEDRIAVSDYGDLQGPPVVFGKDAFERLCALTGDQGARSVVQFGGINVVAVATKAPAFDVDTPSDLAAAAQILSEQK